MSDTISIIVSMAPKAVVVELARDYQLETGHMVDVEASGGVHVKQRLRSGEAFDVVVLASDAIAELVQSGHLVRGSIMDVVRSGVAVAVRSGCPRPRIDSAEAVKRAVLAADTIGCSTGPSGAGILALFQRWGISDSVHGRIVTPPPGVPVGTLVASGDVALGFQQQSELLPIDGIDVVGPLPPEIEIVTTFSAGVARASTEPERARAFIAFLAGPGASDAKCRQGMTPVTHYPEAAEHVTS